MTRPRPSRKARWAIGLSLTTIFSVVALGASIAALAQLTSGLDTESDPSSSTWADSTTKATILDVDVYNLDDELESRHYDREGGDAGYAEVDIKFKNNGKSRDGETKSLAWMSWPDELDLPEVGDEILVEYNSGEPEYLPQLSGTADGWPQQGILSVMSKSQLFGGRPMVAAGQDERRSVTAPVRWTIVISGTLALLTLIGTVIWARRAAPAEVTGRPLGGWNQPGWGQQYPAQPYPSGQQPYPLGQQYPASQYPPQSYQNPSYPPQYPTPHSPIGTPEPTPPIPPPGGLVPPG